MVGFKGTRKYQSFGITVSFILADASVILKKAGKSNYVPKCKLKYQIQEYMKPVFYGIKMTYMHAVNITIQYNTKQHIDFNELGRMHGLYRRTMEFIL